MEGIGESCGLVGVWGSEEASYLVYLGLYALQHRGQESAGIVSSDGKTLQSAKAPGLVSDVFAQADFARLPGRMAMGHVRYSTTGSGRFQNIQPLVVEQIDGLLAVAHNGNLVNARTLRRKYQEKGAIFETSTDSEVIVHLLADPEHRGRPDAMGHCLNHLQGAYCFLFMTRDRLMAARDPLGFRPLCIGELDDAVIITSETCVLDLLKARYLRDVRPGELVWIEDGMLHSETFREAPPGGGQCIFEHVYFARPDSRVFGENVHQVRLCLGRRLAEEQPADADVVVSVPDSGTSAALGYSQASGIPLDLGFIRNHYVGRTFIMPFQKARRAGVEIKLNVVREVVEGRRVVVVDDSVIRGTTSRGRLDQLRRAGAKEIHLRISCPPTRHACYYGIDFPSPSKLIAARKRTDEIADFLEIDSMGYISQEGLLSAVSKPDAYCTACFSGRYPVRPAEKIDKLSMEGESRS
jgi:amidophosphoribosyltransferase